MHRAYSCIICVRFINGEQKVQENLLLQAEKLHSLLVSAATDGYQEKDNQEFVQLRHSIVSENSLKQFCPRFLHSNRNLKQFRSFMQSRYLGYKERRGFLQEEFHPMLTFLEKGGLTPSDEPVTIALKKIDSGHIQAEWGKALNRRSSDPEGAITIARTLVESVCKHILDESNISYDKLHNLPALYKEAAGCLNLLPSQHNEDLFKQILGGCTSVIEGLGALRNRLGDAHGKGKFRIKPAPRHAELAVNLSGALASYLIATWENRNIKQP